MQAAGGHDQQHPSRGSGRRGSERSDATHERSRRTTLRTTQSERNRSGRTSRSSRCARCRTGPPSSLRDHSYNAQRSPQRHTQRWPGDDNLKRVTLFVYCQRFGLFVCFDCPTAGCRVDLRRCTCSRRLSLAGLFFFSWCILSLLRTFLCFVFAHNVGDAAVIARVQGSREHSWHAGRPWRVRDHRA